VYHEVQHKFLRGIFTILAVSSAWTSHDIIWLFLVGGVPALLVKAYPTPMQTRSVIPLLGMSPFFH
jgi:hypothetical protein